MISRVKIEANGSRINSTEEFAIIIKGMKSGERILTLLKRGNSYLYRSIRVRE